MVKTFAVKTLAVKTLAVNYSNLQRFSLIFTISNSIALPIVSQLPVTHQR